MPRNTSAWPPPPRRSSTVYLFCIAPASSHGADCVGSRIVAVRARGHGSAMASAGARPWPGAVAAALLVGAAVCAQPAPPSPIAPIAVADPLLRPPPAAALEVASWDPAVQLIRHSPELVIDIEAVARARALARIAL